MSLEETINTDYVTAMKAKDSVKSGTLNFLRAAIKNIHIDKKVETLEDTEVIAVLKKQVKQRQDSITQFGQGGRQDLVDKEQAELDILKGYLPEEMSEEKLEEIVKATIQQEQANSMKDMGKVMKAVLAKVEGQADNGLVSTLIKKALSN